jgi:hypothetical protein
MADEEQEKRGEKYIAGHAPARPSRRGGAAAEPNCQAPVACNKTRQYIVTIHSIAYTYTIGGKQFPHLQNYDSSVTV